MKLAALGNTVDPRQRPEPRQHALALLDDLPNPLVHDVPVPERGGRGLQRHDVDVVGQFRLGDLPRHHRVGQREAEAKSGQPERLAERAQDHEPGALRQKRQRRGAAELLVGLVADHQRARLFEHSPHRAFRQRRACGVVRRVEHHDPGALANRRLDQRIDVIGKVGAKRHRPVSATQHPRQQAVQRERRARRHDDVRRLERDGERGLNQLVGAVTDEHAFRDPAVAFGEGREQRGRSELGIPLPGRSGRCFEHLALELRRQVPRTLVLVELPSRARRARACTRSARAPRA